MTTYYVKNGGNNANTGLSDAQAWETLAYALSQVAGTSSAHVVLLKCGDTFTKYGNTGDTWNARGTDKNTLATLGAYYMDGGTETRGVSGAKPILDGDFRGNWTASTSSGAVNSVWAPQHGFFNGCWYRVITAGTFGSTPPSWPITLNATVVSGTAVLECHPVAGGDNYSYKAGGGRITVSASDCDYFRFENLQVGNHRARALDFAVPNTANGGIAYHEISNCDLIETGDVLIFNGQYANVDNEWVHDEIYGYHGGCGSRDGRGLANRPRPAYLWYRGRLSSTGVSLTRELKNSIFTRCWQEYINAAQKVLTHDNIFHATQCGTYHHQGYSTTAYGCYYNETYNNIYCGTTDEADHYQLTGFAGTAIGFSSEFPDYPSGCSNNKCYNNLIAFCNVGLALTFSNPPVVTFDNSDFVFNTVIDCNIAFRVILSGAITNGRVKNNIFYSYTPGMTGYSGASNSILGLDSDYNLWNSSGAAGTMAGANDVYSDPLLYKNAGWQSFNEYTEITAADFRPISGSPALGAGLTISGYTVDYNGTTRTSPPSIGAWDTASGTPGGGGGGTSDVPTVYQSDITTSGYISSSGDNKTTPKPTNLIDDNLVLFIFHASDSSATSGSNVNDVETSDGQDDFTEVASSRGTGATGTPETAVWWRLADSDPANYEYDSTVAFHRAVTVRVDGINTADPIEQYSAANSGTTSVTSLVITGVTTAADNALLLIPVSIRNNTTTNHACAEADGLLYDYTDGTSRKLCFYKLVESAGATGDFTITWTTTSRASGMLVEINAGTTSTDITPPLWDTLPNVTDQDDTSVDISAELTDDSAPIAVYGVASEVRYSPPSIAQIIAGTDSNGITSPSDSDTNVSSATPFALSFTGLSSPKVRLSFHATDDEGNAQLSAYHMIVLLDAPSGSEYTEVTINANAASNSALAGLTYAVGDVIVYPSVTNEDSLPISIDGEGTITITRGGNTDPQTFDAYLWSQATGATQPITFQDPFYQSNIGPFGNSADTILIDTTVYVVAAIDADEDGNYEVPAHRPLNIIQSVADGVAVPVSLDSSGIGVYYNTSPGKYYGDVYNADGSYMGKLGYNGVIGITVA